jgi:hypothetical protein
VETGKVATPDSDQQQAAMPANPDLTPGRGFARTGSIARSVGPEGRIGGIKGGLFGRK